MINNFKCYFIVDKLETVKLFFNENEYFYTTTDNAQKVIDRLNK